MDLNKLSLHNQEIAWAVLEDTQVVRLWEEIGAKVNLVGSLKSGLLMKHRDIDLHIYTDELSISDSFAVMAKLAEHPWIQDITYRNLIRTEEACIEWHAWYEENNRDRWQLDLIHIRKGSLYDGVVERVTDAVVRKLTPETKEAILRIKYELPEEVGFSGLQVYRAVLTGGARTSREFWEWNEKNPFVGNVLDWRP